jgi:hypothetical protein
MNPFRVLPVPDDEFKVEAKPNSHTQLIDPWGMPNKPCTVLAKLQGDTYSYRELWAVGPMAEGRLPRGQYNVAKNDDTAPCVKCYDPRK